MKLNELREALDALRSFSGEIKGKAGYYLDHSRWHAEHPPGHSDPTVWFHGTTRPFNTLKHPRQTGSNTQHVDALLGVHFAHSPEVTEIFTDQGYQSQAELKAAPTAPRVLPVRLHIENPRHFETERDINALALSTALYDGTIHPHEVQEWMDDNPTDLDEDGGYIPDVDDLERAQWDSPERTAEKFKDVANDVLKYGLRYGDSASEENYGGEGFVQYNPESGEWDAAGKNHPRMMRVARGLRRYLESQGHDGVTYKNEVEGGIGAIAFSPNQVHEAYGHGDTSRSFASPSLQLLPTHADPRIKRWQNEATWIHPDVQPHAERLRQRLVNEANSYGRTYQDRKESMDLLYGNVNMQGKTITPEHMAHAIGMLPDFSHALVDHLYSGGHSRTPHGRAMLERLSHLQFHLGGRDPWDAWYRKDEGGAAAGNSIVIHPAVLGMMLHPEYPEIMGGGIHTPETVLMHEVGHAVDHARGMVADGVGLHGYTPEHRARQMRTPGDENLSPQEVSGLHSAIYERGVDPRHHPPFNPYLRGMPHLPPAVSRLHYALSGFTAADDRVNLTSHQAGFHSPEFITTLSELALNHPEGLQAIHRSFPSSIHPADLVRMHWGFDFPEAEKAKKDSVESNRIHDEIEEGYHTRQHPADLMAVHHPRTVRFMYPVKR